MKNQQQDAPLEFYYAKYRELDPQEVVTRTGLMFDAEKSRFAFKTLGFTVFADWPEFRLVSEDEQGCLQILTGFYMKILAVRYLLEGVRTPPRGGFKAYRELPWGEIYDANFQGRCIKRLAFSYGNKPDVFADAARKLCGTELSSSGDRAFDMPVFENIVCRLILWCGDDEFPPSAQFLFSDNVQFAWNAEDLAGLGDLLIGALKEVSAKLQ